jgi:hypothetical protein
MLLEGTSVTPGSAEQNSELAGDINRNLKTTLGTSMDKDIDSISTREANYSYLNITTATTTIVKSSSGKLKRIVLGETAAGTIIIYDNTAGSGTIIATLKASISERAYDFDCVFGTGLTIVTAAASKLTVIYE